MTEQDTYSTKGSGFTLQYIDGLLLGIIGVYKYMPMSGSSYIPFRLVKIFEKNNPTVFVKVSGKKSSNHRKNSQSMKYFR